MLFIRNSYCIFQLDTWVTKLAHIDCQKDTYEILRDTITPLLNTDINKLIDGKNVMCLFKTKNNEYSVQLKSSNFEEVPTFVCLVTKQICSKFHFVRSCSIRLRVTGDLAFYASLLGKVNMSGNWCIWCKLSHNEWSSPNHKDGDAWTNDAMDNVRKRIENGDIEDNPSNRKGCVSVPLFNNIGIENYIFPVLHCEIGLGNYLLNSFFDWVDFRIEDTTIKEREMKNDFEIIVTEIEELEKKSIYGKIIVGMIYQH